MKRKRSLVPLILPVVMSVTAQAEVIYSNLRDISIPANFNGVYLNVLSGANSGSEFSGWHVNAIFGGFGFFNSPDFQPLREANSGDATLRNISIGALVGSSSMFYATGFGASDTHLGTTFTAGQEGYIGFSINNNSATNYGWMRVVFDSAGDAFIRDWAYDTSGNSIHVARIQQSAAVHGTQAVTLSSGAGESFTLSSAISDTGGNINSVLINGLGHVSLTATNTHTGATTIESGTLSIDGTGSLNNSNLTLDGGTFRYNSSVNYTGNFTFTEGTIGGTNLNGSLDNLVIGTGQVLSPGNSVGTVETGSQTWAGGGSYQWEINDATGTAGADPGWDLLIGTGTLTITATNQSPFTILVESLGIIGDEIDAANFNEFSSYAWLIAEFSEIVGFDQSKFAVDTSGFTNLFSGNFAIALVENGGAGNRDQLYLTYSAIPEPRVALLAALGFACLLRRSRSNSPG
jgi:autotransporter-associated beta strand protein